MSPEIKRRIEQIRRGETPKGYIRLHYYIIPAEWTEVQLSKLGMWVGGGTPSKSASAYWHNGTIFWISSQEVKESIIRKTKYKITTRAVQESATTLVPPNTIVVVSRSGILQHTIPIAKTATSMAINQDIKALILNQSLDVDYVINAIKSKEETLLRKYTKKGTTVESLLFDAFSNFVIPYAPKEERAKISAILTTQDKVIELKEKRLAEKLRQKKYLMQQLLTGRKRLTGFRGEWREEYLGKLFRERKETNCEGLEMLAITGTQGIIPRKELDLKDNSSEDKSKYLRVCIGDIGYNTMRMWQGVSAYSNYEGIVSPAYTILKPSLLVDANFFAYLFKMPEMIFLFYRFSQGLVDDTRNLKYENFKKIKVVYPVDKSEQTAIAQVLSTADHEIGLLQQGIEQEKQKKKALMQLLLTGIVRVNV